MTAMTKNRSTKTVIKPDIVQAYLETEYIVYASDPFTLQIGKKSVTLIHLHNAYSISSSAFMTACNPYSRMVDDETNKLRQMALAAELLRRGIQYIKGGGRHPSNHWPVEESFLIIGLNLYESREMGRQLEQNAFVWTGEDGIPELILLR